MGDDDWDDDEPYDDGSLDYDEVSGLDSPTDSDEYEMNPDDCAPDPIVDEE